jgi:hypothetical protein
MTWEIVAIVAIFATAFIAFTIGLELGIEMGIHRCIQMRNFLEKKKRVNQYG